MTNATAALDPVPAGVAAADAPPARFAAEIEQSVEARHAALRRRTIVVRIIQVSLFVAFMAIWEVGSRVGLIRPLFFSSPTAVVAFIIDNWPILVSSIQATMWAALLGYAIGCSTGILAGLLLAQFTTLDRILDPFLTMLNSLPRIALAPVLLLWFGISVNAKVALAVSLLFFILLINTRTSAREVDPDLLKMGTVLGATPMQRLLYITVPAALPGIFAGLRIGVVYALFGAVASEMVIARAGLGLIAMQYGQNLQTDGVFAILALTAVIAWSWTGLVVLIEKLALGNRR